MMPVIVVSISDFGFRIWNFEFRNALLIPQHSNHYSISPVQKFEIRNPKFEIDYSYLSATIGSTFVARRAGSKHAINATNASNNGTTTNGSTS